MEQLVSQEEVHQALMTVRRDGIRVGFVPTMGALHEGHLALVRAARARSDYVVVSIFVNPLQFGPDEDFAAYPRDIPGDLELLEAEGVDAVFTPTAETMYREGATTTVQPGPLGDVLEGAVRPGHFTGVCTVVAKLFHITRPDLAFFGEKDYQQLVIVRRMVADLDFPIGIVGVPIVREPDGLALSSRNAYLSAEERRAATVLSRALDKAQALVAAGERDGAAVRAAMEATFAEEPLASLDYAAVAHPETLADMPDLASPARALVAARIGRTRLIDNAPLVPAPTTA